jgi:hypothetical protein
VLQLFLSDGSWSATHADVEAALLACIRAELPALLMDELRADLPEFTPKYSVSLRRDRDNLIRARYNGENAVELAGQFGLSPKQITRIGRGVK